MVAHESNKGQEVTFGEPMVVNADGDAPPTDSSRIYTGPYIDKMGERYEKRKGTTWAVQYLRLPGKFKENGSDQWFIEPR